MVPQARIAPGFATVVLTLADGETVTGTLLEESDELLVLEHVAGLVHPSVCDAPEPQAFQDLVCWG